jgi:hypothetical protein
MIPSATAQAAAAPWWLVAGRAFVVGLVGTLLEVWFLTFPAPFLRPGWPIGLAMLAGLGALAARLDGRSTGLGSIVLGVAAAISVDLLVVVRSAGQNGTTFIDAIRPPETWRSELTGDLRLGLLLAGAAWLAVAGGRALLARDRRGLDRVGRPSAAWAAAPLLAGAALLVGLWGLPALVAEASRTRVVLPVGLQRIEVTLHADSISIAPATVHAGDVWITTSTDAEVLAQAETFLEGPWGPLTDGQVSGLRPGQLDPGLWSSLSGPGPGTYSTQAFEPGRYAWLAHRWVDPQTPVLVQVAILTVDSSTGPALPAPLSPDAPGFGAALVLVLAATGLGFAAVAAGAHRPRTVMSIPGLRLAWIALVGVGAPLLLAGLMEVYVSLVRSPF